MDTARFPLRFNYGHIAMPARSKRASDPSIDDVESSVATEEVGEVDLRSASAFASAEGAAPDPILSMRDAYLADPAEKKLNLAVGVYRTAEGQPYVLDCVQEAEADLLETQREGRAFKEYLPPVGMASFCEASLRLLLGESISAPLAEDRVVTAQSLSGTGGLHLAARMLAQLKPGATVHLPTPTWPIHPDIFTTCGLKVSYYPYYDPATCGLNFDGMIATLSALPIGSVVLLHACAHNPTGVDPTWWQWGEIAKVVAQRALLPLVDAAYQGFASGDLDLDARGVRMLAAIEGVEMITVQSYSKNMGLYAERAGVLAMICRETDVAERCRQQLARTIRLTHSSPPQHGAAIVAKILSEPDRTAKWRVEVAAMAKRLLEMREALSAALARIVCPPPTGTSLTSWRHVTEQRGMFTYTGLTPTQVEALRVKHHIYMPADGRISMASLTVASCDVLAAAIRDVLKETVVTDTPLEPPAKRQQSTVGRPGRRPSLELSP